MNMNESLQSVSHVQINRTKLRTVGTFLVPIGALFFYFVLYSFPLSYLDSKFPDYSHLLIRWSGLSLHPWKALIGVSWGIFGLVIAFVFLYKSERLRPKDCGLVWFSGHKNFNETIKLNIIIIITLFLFFVTLFNVAYRLSGQETVDAITNFYFNCYHGKIEITFRILGPVFEEILFRGIYCALLIRHGFKWPSTILITSTVFGLTHLINHQSYPIFYLIQPCFATVAGLFYGWVFYKTRTLMMPIAWHYAINIMIYFSAVRPDLLSKIANHLIYK